MTTYMITFARIGRHRDVPPLPVDVTDDRDPADVIAERVHGYAQRFLISRGFDVAVDLAPGAAHGSGWIATGQPAGDFEIIRGTVTTP